MLIDAFAQVSQKVNKAKLTIIGSGPIEEYLKNKAKGLNIEFKGFIGDISRVYSLLSHCAFGVAPYEDNTISQYTDPGKVKVYLTVGLPMVISKVPRVAFEIEKEKCGFAINYEKNELMDAMIKFLTDDGLLKSYRDNTERLAEKYRWNRIFEKALNHKLLMQ